ncbi:transposase [Streptomyces bottropensis]|uniref:transposase n=1 Tax=Streptomyces bottropensis TaxID=42235 RepID=UPI003685B0BF
MRTGAPWRDLPAEYGPQRTDHGLFRNWRRDVTWIVPPSALKRSCPQAIPVSPPRSSRGPRTTTTPPRRRPPTHQLTPTTTDLRPARHTANPRHRRIRRTTGSGSSGLGGERGRQDSGQDARVRKRSCS